VPSLLSEKRAVACVLAVGLALISVFAYPGLMAYDSLDQLRQARAGMLTDWHPPLMSALWGAFDKIIPGAAPMLVLQCSLFLIGTYFVLRRRCSRRAAALLTVALFVFPPTFAMMAVILKDNLMCGLLLVGCAAITSPRRGIQYLALLAFFMALSLRHNAFAAVLPLLVWLSPWPHGAAPWRRRVVGSLGTAVLAVAALGCNRLLTDVKTHPFHYSVVPMDIIGTLRFADPLPDDDCRVLLAGIPIRISHQIQAKAIEQYDPGRWWGFYIYGAERFMDEPSTPELRNAFFLVWRRLVTDHLSAYLVNRLDMFRELVGVTDRKWTPVYGIRNEKNMLAGNGEPPQTRNALQQWLSSRMVRLGVNSVMFRPYLYLVALLALLVVFRRDRLMSAIQLSALGYLALLFIVSPSPDIRYAHWMMVVAGIGLAVRLFESKTMRLQDGFEPVRAAPSVHGALPAGDPADPSRAAAIRV
jgi:hypothetical protein